VCFFGVCVCLCVCEIVVHGLYACGCVFVCVYMCVCMRTCVYVCMYAYMCTCGVQRERQRNRERYVCVCVCICAFFLGVFSSPMRDMQKRWVHDEIGCIYMRQLMSAMPTGPFICTGTS
jgi:NADH:ubiquinone oxidoreductase subunit 4 (subunit M)